MSLLSWLFPRKAAIQSNKDAFREAWKQEIIQSMLQAGMSGKRANREDKYKDFMATEAEKNSGYKETKTIIRKR